MGFVLGFLRLGRGEWDGRRRKKKKKEDGERKKRMKEEESKAGTRVPRGFEIHLSFTSTENLSLLGSSCYGELESKRLKMLVYYIIWKCC